MTEERTLELHEQRYISSVRDALIGLTGSTRRHLIATLEENLRDRPVTADADELTAALGTPLRYANQLMEETDAARPGTIARSRLRHRVNVAVVNTLVIALVAAVVLIYRWWDTWQADLSAQSSRICGGDGNEDTCDQSLFTDVSNPLGDVTRVDCMKGKTFTLALGGFRTSRPVEVTGVDFPGTDLGGGSLLRLDDVTVHQRVSPEGRFSPAPVPFPIAVGDRSAPFGGDLNEFRLHFTLICSATDWGPASSATFDHFRVRYHALGKDRVQDIPLQSALQILMPAE